MTHNYPPSQPFTKRIINKIKTTIIIKMKIGSCNAALHFSNRLKPFYSPFANSLKLEKHLNFMNSPNCFKITFVIK